MQQARRKYPALCANLRMIQNKTHILRVRLEGSVCKSAEPVPFDGLSKALFRPAKQVEAWGRAYACMWLKLSGKVPDDLKKPYLLIRNTGESLLYTQNGIPFDAVIVAVGHEQFKALGGEGVRAFGKPGGSVVYDVKYVLPRDAVDGRL